ncbi:UDP-N-acetylmuramoyl-L-alanine--D-glutamate ligase [Comamonas sp. Y6]|uniref:UDP-N-acetylmuramoylalanine--D-glutamate ligase n=1 Tax=Comamonas resistens TaxID=3046670 RepID=A0ABY8SQY0_9BURK|nr:UDP-N-acetylmuramoyl-L-alanine--D-glutamate ligase [Comamonas resistens]MDL5036463.1 UDP-N-acetylmuramoyl-L-alanine--D-glutamate ligase [Comamonas resistens]WHS64805.1 UDP-N-acetylmuramoyl-L-alanine--D-glutamate ligase [Comamonas resistens]
MQDEDLTLDHQLPAQQLEAAMQMQAVDADAVTIADEFPSEVIEQRAAEATEVEVQTPRSDAAPASVAVLAQALGAEPPIPDISTLTAARDAAAFVAQIFADPSVSDAADAEVTTVEQQPEAVEETVVELPPVPVYWPQGAAQHLQGQRVLILGLGISGIAMARWCVRAGAEVTVADTREAPPFLPALQAELPGVRFVAGGFTGALVDGQNLSSVYRSPGLSPASVAPVFHAARSIGLPTGGELDLFAFALKGLREAHGYAPKVLGITGTNGKTTVTSLTGQLLEHAGMTVGVAGNIGPSLLDTLSERIDAETLPQAWVLELSSFQLDDCHDFEPTAATVLNITQDHLDWHGGMQAYAAAKAHVFGEQGLMVLNREDPVVMAMLPAPVPVPGKRGKTFQRAYITFGGDMPRRPGDFGLEVVNGMTWLVRAHEADETSKGKNADDLHIVRLMPADALRIRGRHNAINALSALALATGAGCTLAPLLYGLREYRGEPHRVQPVGRVSDVEYFDDSKGTNVGATVAALMGLGPDHRIVVILGGLGKGQDFAPLAAPVSRYVRAAVLIGQDAPQIREALADTGVKLADAASMQEAVQQAARLAHANDAVLLSPACASMDMFKDYADRAHQFVEAVRELALDAGQQLEDGA